MNRKLFLKNTPPSAVLFMSGTGTNAEKLLSDPRRGKSWFCSAVVTDRAERSRAPEIAERFGVPLVVHDIYGFYREHGLESISIASPAGLAVRELWTEALRRKIAPFHPDFGILAGFIPLSNIVGDFPCLNVHPGDLTVESEGRRILAGLHSGPVETAILLGHPALRSSVIVATPYTRGAKEMDSGFVLGVSAPVPVILPEGTTLSGLREISAARKKGKGRNDLLGRIADEHIERLKEEGDWKLFPEVVDAFARNLYSFDGSVLFWSGSEGEPVPVRTVRFENGEVLPEKSIPS